MKCHILNVESIYFTIQPYSYLEDERSISIQVVSSNKGKRKVTAK
ncbi:hypothetical protein FQV37_2899 [Psychrobacter nivimaris]|uniref:Uncharacterized protein n=1 Tax=Psychrobacter nivimaris TaxID=281738 RepID=A0A6N7BYE5_9GAMM|nr:hypothetical protein FQV37_2899 [Psychrobacter nivimaris]